MINLFDDEPQRFGEALGGTLWGGTLYELAPGQESPYHWQFGEEECLIVVAGRPTLRTPDGERVLEPWDVAWFVRGESGRASGAKRHGRVRANRLLLDVLGSGGGRLSGRGVVGFIADWSRPSGPARGKVPYQGRDT